MPVPMICNRIAPIIAPTTVPDPPTTPDWGSFGSHCGMRTAAQRPAVSGAFWLMSGGAHTALSQLAIVPSARAAAHSGVKVLKVATTPSSTSPFQ